jgi:hypothetical protein
MIHFPTSDRTDTFVPDPRDRATNQTPAQLRAIMRALDVAMAESQRLRADSETRRCAVVNHDVPI